MSLKTAEDLGLINKEQIDVVFKIASDMVLSWHSDENPLTTVQRAEAILKIIDLETQIIEKYQHSFVLDFKRAVLLSVFKMWNINPMQFAIEFIAEFKEEHE